MTLNKTVQTIRASCAVPLRDRLSRFLKVHLWVSAGVFVLVLIAGAPAGGTSGALAGIVAMLLTLLSLVLVFLRFRNWRAWISLVICLFAVAASLFRTPPPVS